MRMKPLLIPEYKTKSEQRRDNSIGQFTAVSVLNTRINGYRMGCIPKKERSPSKKGMEHKKSISLIYDNRQLLRGLVPQEVVDGRHLCVCGAWKSSWEPGHVQGYPAPALLCGPPEQGMLMATVSGGFCMISTPALSLTLLQSVTLRRDWVAMRWKRL